MGLLGSLFNDVVGIVAAPIKVITIITDTVIDSDFTETAEAIQDRIKVED
jgi:hypothetical protein